MTKQNDAINESLSALMDGEHAELDLHRVLKAAESDDTVLDTWSSYHLSRQTVNKELDLVCDSGFLAGIQAAIADDEVEQNGSHSSKVSSSSEISNVAKYASFRRFAAKGAVAACFAFAVLIGVNQLQPGAELTQPESLAATSTEATAVVPSGFELPPLTARTVSSVPSENFLLSQQRSANAAPSAEFVLSPEMQDQLNHMIRRHAERSSANGGLGILPFSRVNVVESAEK